jgi:hypothetical protein
MTALTAPSRAQKAFDEVSERHVSEPSLVIYASIM